MNTIPTNHGNLTVGQVMDSLTYSAYRSNRNEGCSAGLLSKWFANADQCEEIYQTERQRRNN